MKKMPIALVSILKPVDDPRSFERIGFSLAKTNKYEVNIIGFGTKKNTKVPNVRFHPLGNFHRISIKRFLVRRTVFHHLKSINPTLLIITTHELLLTGILYKLRYGTPVIYDIQENYFRNLFYQNNYPFLIKHLLALIVRFKESVISYLVDGFLLAERGYDQELTFHRGKPTLVLENKYAGTIDLSTRPGGQWYNMIFTGNLSESSGVIQAIHFFEAIKKEEPKSTLLIIGHAPNSGFLELLKTTIIEQSDIKLVGGNEIVDHTDILREISQAGTGIVSYTINPSNLNSIPTKIFEYIALNLPFVSQENIGYTNYAQKFPGCLAIDFDNPDIKMISQQLKHIRNTSSFKNTHEVLWTSQEEELLQFINEINT